MGESGRKQESRVGINEILKRALWRQLGRPSGLPGRVIERLMTAHNAAAHDLTLSHAGLEPNDRVLEVGFGCGTLVEKALRSAPGVTVRGIDASGVMVERANARNAEAVREGRAELRFGSVYSLPYSAESFEKALSVHSIYFWPDPIADVGEVLRVLVPGGRVVVAADPSEPLEDPVVRRTGYETWSRGALLTVFEEAGLVDKESASRQDLGLVCVWGHKRT